MKQYEGVLRCVQVMPLDDEGVPLSEIYGPVLIEEDMTAVKKTRRTDEPSGRKTLENVADMFYVNDNLAKNVFMQGEAGHGKTVFCLNVLESWSKGKICRGAEGETGSGSVRPKHTGKEVNEETQGSMSDCGSDERLGGTRKSTSCSLQLEKPDLFTTVHQQDEDKNLQNCLSLFDLVFYVPLRHATHGISTIVDLVCGSVSECDKNTEHKIKQMLRDGEIKCLVILDGLDEWRAPDKCRVRGFPDSDGLVNCTLLCTMRPWRMINLRLGLDSTCDKVLHILGLMEESIKTVISNLLVNFFGLELSSTLYEDKLKRFCKKAELPELGSLMKVPLMLTASCLVWKEEDEVSGRWKNDQSNSDSPTSPYFMTSFYLKLTEVMITRGEIKHGIVRSFLDDKRQNTEKFLNVQSILCGFDSIIDFFEVIKPVGKLALQDLLSDEPHLVFPLNKLEREIGQSKVELALKVGILSQSKAPGLSYQRRVSVSFYHKSIQEFIAALDMVCGDTEALASFRTQCNTVDKVMELSNMIMFVFGLDSVVGCQLSKHVKDVVNNDADIMQYRGKFYVAVTGYRKVQELYKIQCKWFREMKRNLSYTHNSDPIPSLQVTDVYLDNRIDRDNVSVATELVSREDNSIVSMYLGYMKPTVHSIIEHLPRCKHLTILYITDIRDTQYRELLVKVLPQLVHLQYVVYRGFDYGEESPLGDMAVVRAMQQLPALRRVKLHKITLTGDVTLSPQLQKVELDQVKPAPFILPSLPGCPYLTSLDIRCSDMDTMEDCEMLASVLPQLQHLQFIDYNHDVSSCGSVCHAVVVSALQHLTQLTHIELWYIDLGDAGTLLVTPHMTQLQKVTLWSVRMSARRWAEFLSSLLSVQHTVHVTLRGIDIDGYTLNTLHSSPHFTVTVDEREIWDPDTMTIDLDFHTVQ